VSACVSLSKSIYPRRCVEEAAVAYSTICSVDVVGETPHALEVEVKSITGQSEVPDEGRITHEFLNYLLDLSLEYHLRAA
jgi:hypothetical protein